METLVPGSLPWLMGESLEMLTELGTFWNIQHCVKTKQARTGGLVELLAVEEVSTASEVSGGSCHLHPLQRFPPMGGKGPASTATVHPPYSPSHLIFQWLFDADSQNAVMKDSLMAAPDTSM